MGISDRIESFIIELLKEDTECAEFGRNELAEIFGCVPSQINYVISTRFNPEKGYTVESQRGGGGYIRIKRIPMKKAEDAVVLVGKTCNFREAKTVINFLFERGDISLKTAKVLTAAVSDNAIAIPNPARDMVRANILKNALCEI